MCRLHSYSLSHYQLCRYALQPYLQPLIPMRNSVRVRTTGRAFESDTVTAAKDERTALASKSSIKISKEFDLMKGFDIMTEFEI